jgi:arabinogalactan endo-1,4-beta-galactosidase
VKVVFSDDSIRKVPVTWAAVDPSALQQAGTFTVNGTVEGSDLPAAANVTVSSQANFLTNPGFETGDLTGWTVSGDPAADVSNEAQNVYEDVYALHYWLGDPFQFTLSQTVAGLSNGTYTFSLWIQGGGSEDKLQMFAKDCGGPTQTVDITDTGWQAWTNPTITGIPVTEGTCTVGLTVVAPGGNWAFVDTAQLSREK